MVDSLFELHTWTRKKEFVISLSYPREVLPLSHGSEATELLT